MLCCYSALRQRNILKNVSHFPCREMTVAHHCKWWGFEPGESAYGFSWMGTMAVRHSSASEQNSNKAHWSPWKIKRFLQLLNSTQFNSKGARILKRVEALGSDCYLCPDLSLEADRKQWKGKHPWRNLQIAWGFQKGCQVQWKLNLVRKEGIRSLKVLQNSSNA